MKNAESSPKGKKILWEMEKLLFTRCFLKTYSANTLKQGLVWATVEEQKAFVDRVKQDQTAHSMQCGL